VQRLLHLGLLTPVTWFDFAFRGISSCAFLGRLALVAGFVRSHPPRVGRRLCACLLLFLRDHGAPATLLRATPLGLCCCSRMGWCAALGHAGWGTAGRAPRMSGTPQGRRSTVAAAGVRAFAVSLLQSLTLSAVGLTGSCG